MSCGRGYFFKRRIDFESFAAKSRLAIIYRRDAKRRRKRIRVAPRRRGTKRNERKTREKREKRNQFAAKGRRNKHTHGGSNRTYQGLLKSGQPTSDFTLVSRRFSFFDAFFERGSTENAQSGPFAVRCHRLGERSAPEATNTTLARELLRIYLGTKCNEEIPGRGNGIQCGEHVGNPIANESPRGGNAAGVAGVRNRFSARRSRGPLVFDSLVSK